MVKDQDKALEAIIYSGCARILTSGGQQTAPQGIEKLADLVKKAGDRIAIMPGSGVNLNNIIHIVESTGAKEMHLSARSFIPGKMNFKKPSVTMGGKVSIPDYELQLPDEKMIREILKLTL
jgi:copper homeostasis protein